MDWNTKTVSTYDASAKVFAQHFNDTGLRVKDIELGLMLARAQPATARVVEIGCGSGRDAPEIIKRVTWYEGVDPSEGLLNIARARSPGASFVQADALTYIYPGNLDVIFAFASLLHVSKDDLKTVFKKVVIALRKGGVIYISAKERPQYAEEIQKDQHGERMFYYYNPDLINALAGDGFSEVHQHHYVLNETDWFNIALKKN